MKNVLKGSIFYVIIAIIVVLGINYIRGNLVENTGVTYSQFQKYVAQNKVSGVEVRQNSQGCNMNENQAPEAKKVCMVLLLTKKQRGV